jgi:hypothetical protein
MRERLGLATCLLVALAADAGAVDVGKVKAGQELAREVCGECHVVSKDDTSLVVSAAPSFETIANTPGMTDMALSATLQTSHPSMPDLVLGADDRENVIAFILSLKRAD